MYSIAKEKSQNDLFQAPVITTSSRVYAVAEMKLSFNIITD